MLAIISIIAVYACLAALLIIQQRKLSRRQQRIEELARRNRVVLKSLTLAVDENRELRQANARLRHRQPIRLPDLTWSTISRN